MRIALASTVLGVVLGTFAFRASAEPPKDAPEPSWTDAQRGHWSFVTPTRPDVPAVRHQGSVRNPIDAFLFAEMEALGIEPAPPADRATLARRLRFDLTGLPPTPEEVEAFAKDDRPDAVERFADRLLATPQYGERWARPWLDLARFAESDGFKSDKTRPDAWRYRDWVVEALNADLPYDEFVRLQLAADEVRPDDPSAFRATAFNRNWPFEDNNKVPGQSRQWMLEDVTDTTASVFLGLTVACARCHDHKFDPISQKDYYRVQAIFAGLAAKDDFPIASPAERTIHAAAASEHRARLDRARREVEAVEQPYRAPLLKDRLDKLPAEVREAFETEPARRTAAQEDLLTQNAPKMTVDPKAMRSAMTPEDLRLWEGLVRTKDAIAKDAPPEPPKATGMTDTGPTAPPVFLLRKGNMANPGDEVPPGFLSVLGPTTLPPASPSDAPTTGRRKALADWLTRPDHPLTARVMVNRLWQGHFGRGIVATPSDFGTQGAAPSHPNLLDWLATEFVARGWSQKAMHRLMVTSDAYRRSCIATPEARTNDPENALFGRMSRRRLEGEAVRDALLAASGKLDLRVGGPSVFPDLPPGLETRGGWSRSKSEADRNRRSLYVFARRNLKYPLFDAFDAPDSSTTCPERNVSVNAPQALMLLNSEMVLEYAREFAARIKADVFDPKDPSQLVKQAYRLALGRAPRPEELAKGEEFLKGFGDEPEAALADYCHALLNLNEFVFVD